MNKLVKDYYKNCEITHHTELVNYSLSTGLFERVVQGLVIFLRIKCIEYRTTNAWFFHI